MLPVQSRRPAGSIGSGKEWEAWVKTLSRRPSGALVRPRAGLGLPGAVRPLRSRHLQRLISKLCVNLQRSTSALLGGALAPLERLGDADRECQAPRDSREESSHPDPPLPCAGPFEGFFFSLN